MHAPEFFVEGLLERGAEIDPSAAGIQAFPLDHQAVASVTTIDVDNRLSSGNDVFGYTSLNLYSQFTESEIGEGLDEWSEREDGLAFHNLRQTSSQIGTCTTFSSRSRIRGPTL